MTEGKKRYVSVTAATQELEFMDNDVTRRFADKHGCLRKAGPVERIDIDTLKARIDEQFDQEAEANKVTTKSPRVGSKLGLVRARLAQFPKRCAAKEAKIESVTNALAVAKDRYSEIKLEADLAKLRRELDNLTAGKVRDEKLLQDLLNASDPESNS